jgi:hypothetical protein
MLKAGVNEDKPPGWTVRETPDGSWEVVTFPDQTRLSLHATLFEAMDAALNVDIRDPNQVREEFDEVPPMAKKKRAPKKKRTPEPIADAMKECIRNNMYSTYALSKASGVSPGIISRWLNGERGLTLRTAERLVAALDLVLVAKHRVK